MIFDDQLAVGSSWAGGQACGWVGERRVVGEAAEGASRGRHASENAGMSSERGVRNSPAE